MKIWEEVKRNETQRRRAILLQDIKHSVPHAKITDSMQTRNNKYSDKKYN